MNADAQTRRGVERRFTFTQSPYTAQYAERLAKATGMTRADLYNTAMQIMSVMLGVYVDRGAEYVIHDSKTQEYSEDPALQVLLRDIMESLAVHNTADSTP